MATLIGSIVVFLFVVLLHELGHFTVAKLVGIKVNEFSIGMGPKIIQKQGSETKYSLRLLPIGGYVAMEGEEEQSKDPRSFNNVSIPKRMAVVSAGAIMNFFLALVAFFLVFSIAGNRTNIIETVVKDSPAYVSGIQKGDRIISINGKTTKDWTDILQIIGSNKKDYPMEIKLNRSGELLTKKIVPVKSSEGRYMIGITSHLERNLGKSFSSALFITKESILSIFSVFKMIGQGNFHMNMLAGPVGVISIIGRETSKGILNLLQILGIISANLGVMNLLPIPALDGGKLLFLGIEALCGRPIPEEWESKLSFVGFAFLLSLMLYVTVFNDLKIFR